MTHRLALGTLLLALSAVGCAEEDISSADLRTGGIAALIEVTSYDGNLATVTATLKSGGAQSNTYVSLDNGDALSATVGTETKPMRSVDNGVYEAEFTGVTEGTVFTVAMDRPNDDPAPNSTGIMPAPFALTGPASGLSRATDALTATWDPSGKDGDFSLRYSGSCIFDKSYDVAGDPGTHTAAAGDLESTGGDTPEACDIDLRAQRRRVGTADPAFDGESYVRLYQVRGATFTSNP